jgi:hypothetical protein
MNTPTTKLERHVAKWLREYDGGAKSAIHDLMQGGCQAGTVGHLIYYHDTTRFYSRHKAEINAMLAEYLQETGAAGPAELFGDKWDSDDPLCQDTYNQNLLAWFGFEETARRLMDY